MRDYAVELEKRIEFIRNLLKESGAKGIVFGNSGGKDSTLTGILCKKACDNTLSLIMPCHAKRNFDIDLKDGLEVAEKFNIETKVIDVTPIREATMKAVSADFELTDMAVANIAPRLRMTVLYAVAASRNMLVAGTDNKSEMYMGYFTKWGDGGYDFNPIADLTASEVYEFLRYLDAPEAVIKKAPSAALFDDQTDEQEMGITYKKIDEYLMTGKGDKEDIDLIERYHKVSEHKRRMPVLYKPE